MAKPYKRTERIADLIKRELAVIIQQKGENPLFNGVTITHVKLSNDSSHARVFVTVLIKAKIVETINALNESAFFFQHLLAKNVNLRSTPKLRFLYDESVIRGQEISALIDKVIAK